jgi:hypothetical protein
MVANVIYFSGRGGDPEQESRPRRGHSTKEELTTLSLESCKISRSRPEQRNGKNNHMCNKFLRFLCLFSVKLGICVTICIIGCLHLWGKIKNKNVGEGANKTWNKSELLRFSRVNLSPPPLGTWWAAGAVHFRPRQKCLYIKG